MANFHIIGSGLAGLVAATHIARAGHHVQVYEATSSAGGRCALLRDAHKNDGYDGCTALLFGGNREILRFAAQLGSQHSFTLLDAGGVGFDARHKKHTKRSAFLCPPASPLIDVLQLLRMRFLHASADDVFDYYHPLTEAYIEPLCRGIMLCDTADADSSTLAKRVLSIATSGRNGMRLMVAKHSLYQSLVEPSLRQIEHEGGSIYYSHVLKNVVCSEGRIQGLQFTKHTKELRAHDRVIFALPAHILQQLIPDALASPLVARDIVAVHFHVNGTSDSCIIPVTNGVVDWVRQHNGIITSLSYSPASLLNTHDDSIAARMWAQARSALGIESDMPPHRVVRSRRAHMQTKHASMNIRCTANGFLAGEVFGPKHLLPLEAAIVSGTKAAEAALLSI